MSVQHTKGPWHVSKSGNFIRYIQSDLTTANICELSVFGGPDEEAEANAIAIAAVPNMLAALKEIAGHLYSTQDLARCRGIAEEAIKKALPIATQRPELEDTLSEAAANYDDTNANGR